MQHRHKLLAVAGALIILHYGIATKTDPAGSGRLFGSILNVATQRKCTGRTPGNQTCAHTAAQRASAVNGCESAGPATATSRRAVVRDDYAAAATVLRPGTAVEAAQRRAAEAAQRRAEEASAPRNPPELRRPRVAGEHPAVAASRPGAAPPRGPVQPLPARGTCAWRTVSGTHRRHRPAHRRPRRTRPASRRAASRRYGRGSSHVQGARLGAVNEAPGLQSAFDIAGVESIAVDRATGCGVGHEGNQPRTVRASGRVPTGDVRRA